MAAPDPREPRPQPAPPAPRGDARAPVPTGAAARTLAGGGRDALVREEPLLLVVHGQQLLTMRTPGNDADLALGFLLGEGIVQGADDVAAMQFVAGDAAAQRADELHVTLRRAPDAAVRGRLSRTHEIRSSCGICGVADPQQLLDEFPPLLPGVPKLARSRVPGLLRALAGRQPLFAATGGCHGALLAAGGDGANGGNGANGANGGDRAVLGHGEDVGRHNALDKAIGMAARAGADLTRAIAVLSGRAGYDLVVKCLRVRVPIVISVSAPSALAFDLCHAAGATLLGFARGDDCRVYCDAARLTP